MSTISTIYLSPPAEMHERDMRWLLSLPERGWRVEFDGARETPGEFCRRLGIHPMTLVRKLAKSDCPTVDQHRGTAGRLISLRSNPEFEAFCLAGKQADKQRREAR